MDATSKIPQRSSDSPARPPFSSDPTSPSAQPKEIEFLPKNFTIDAESAFQGYAGIPAFVRRARDLEDRIDRFWTQVAERYIQLLQEVTTSRAQRQRWRTIVDELDFLGLERMVMDYNRYFPIEANLPMDPSTGDYMYRGKRFELAVAPTREDVLQRYPVGG